MPSSRIRSAFRAVSLSLIVLSAACQTSEKIAPDGSTISLVATPGTIVLASGVQVTPITILGTVRNSIGLPLPDQDVRFTTTSGTLDPQAGIPVRTDGFGNAITTLTEARQQTTITAQSGKATQTLTINTATCEISTVTLDLSSLTFNTCADQINLTAAVEDTTNQPCQGVSVQFVTSPTSLQSGDIVLIFTPGTKNTDATGQVTTVVSLNQTDCNSKCVNKDCNPSMQQVRAVAGSVSSAPIPFNDNIP